MEINPTILRARIKQLETEKKKAKAVAKAGKKLDAAILAARQEYAATMQGIRNLYKDEPEGKEEE